MRPVRRWSRRRRVGVLAVVAVAAAGCGGQDDSPTPAPDADGRLGTQRDVVSALLALPDGGLMFAERTTGRIQRLDAEGAPQETVATVAVSSEGQRGLLGLARDDRGRLYAAWTDPDARLVVGRVLPDRRLVWRGPAASELGVGGRLVFAPDGRLVIGVGDLEQRDRVDDPRAPNGKLLALDVDAPPDQRPRVLSGGWTNPFAFAFTPSGDLWVADNAIGRDKERLARGDMGTAANVTDLPSVTAPSGLAALSDRELLLCGYVSRELTVYEIGADGTARRTGPPVARDCALGVIRLRDGRLAYARPDSVAIIDAP